MATVAGDGLFNYLTVFMYSLRLGFGTFFGENCGALMKTKENNKTG